jgi:LCP family protein required for cell wall assembly
VTVKRDPAWRKRRRIAKKLGMVACVLLVLAVGVGDMLYENLNGNIKSVPLPGAGGTEKADASGAKPVNVLVIGSDSRADASDCKLGGDCGAGQNADVEMVVHISADHSNATVMSVPRDTVSRIPACKDSQNNTSESGYTGSINSALQYGPACQVAAVHQLTGIPIDHFAMIDFSGVVNMSDAVGGVQVCVDNNIYDPYSHLKLSKGDHTLKGTAALQWLRTRHGFGDGGDLGRTYAQHEYLSALMRKVQSVGTLANPVTLFDIADAATKALTVDTGLDSITKLLTLAEAINQVPTKRITFTTMQTVPDPSNHSRVIVGPGAQSLFNMIINDRSLTQGSSAKASTASPTPSPTSANPSVSRSQIAVQVENGSDVTGRAAAVTQDLLGGGFSPQTTASNAPSSTTATKVEYPPGRRADAQTVAASLRIPDSRLKQDSNVSGVTLVIGSDWSSGSSFPPSADAIPAPADNHQALSGAHAETADRTNTCGQVSAEDTVEINGVPMTPTQAYAMSTDVANSAP